MLVATWVLAIATVLLGVGAGFSVLFAKRAFDEQTKELRTLEAQLKGQP